MGFSSIALDGDWKFQQKAVGLLLLLWDDNVKKSSHRYIFFNLTSLYVCTIMESSATFMIAHPQAFYLCCYNVQWFNFWEFISFLPTVASYFLYIALSLTYSTPFISMLLFFHFIPNSFYRETHLFFIGMNGIMNLLSNSHVKKILFYCCSWLVFNRFVFISLFTPIIFLELRVLQSCRGRELPMFICQSYMVHFITHAFLHGHISLGIITVTKPFPQMMTKQFSSAVL